MNKRPVQKIFGVCVLGDCFNIETTIIRILFLTSVLLLGICRFFYIITEPTISKELS